MYFHLKLDLQRSVLRCSSCSNKTALQSCPWPVSFTVRLRVLGLDPASPADVTQVKRAFRHENSANGAAFVFQLLFLIC